MKKILFSLVCTFAFVTGISAVAGDNLLGGKDVSQKAKWRTWYSKAMREAKIKFSWKDGAVTAKIPEIDKKGKHQAQLYRGLKLEVGKKYKVAFDVKAAKAGTFTLAYILAKRPYTDYAASKVKVEPAKKSYEVILTPKKVNGKYDSPRTIRFFLGNMQGNTVTISNVIVTEIK